MTSLFSQPEQPLDTDTHRTCGECGESKTMDDFYKDGKNPDDSPRYRRDCKECYNIKRKRVKKMKKEQEYKARKRRR